MWTDLRRDVRFAFRLLRRQPGFSLIAVLTLALGIGTATAVFSLADWVLLRPLPGTSGTDRVVTIELRTPEDRLHALSIPNLQDVAEGVPALRSVAGWQLQLMQLRSGDDAPVQVFAEVVAGDYFDVMGLQPRLGRGLRSDESRPGQRPAVAVISSDLWRSMFGSDPDVVGRVVQANRQSLTIVGVAPDGFRGAERMGRIDVWVPATLAAALRHMPDAAALDARSARILGGWAGRLAPGATVETVRAQLAALLPRLAARHPADNEALATVRPALYPGAGLTSTARADLERAVRILGLAVALVLAIACVNVANMLVSRGVARAGDDAVRRALGAGRARLVRQDVAEGLMLGLASVPPGVLVALLIRAIFQDTRLQMIELSNVPLDGRVFGFAVLASLATGALFGLLPALSRPVDAAAALRRAGTRATTRVGIVRPAITVAQLSMSMALLVAALLLTRTLANYGAIEPGYDTRLASFTIDMQPQGYTAERRSLFEAALLERLHAAPEFTAAAITQTPPFAGFYGVGRLLHPATNDTVSVVAEWISPGYFETLSAELVAGRPLGPQDMGAGDGVRSVVVSEALARRLFGPEPVLGRTVRMAGRTPGDLRVVGVAANKRVRNLTGEPESVLYEPYDAPSRLALYTTVVVRSNLSVARTEMALREIVDAIDPALPFMYVERLSDKLARVTAEQRLFARLLLTLASIALVMAAVGLYAVIAHSVAARTREIGIRMALGADRRRILRMVLRQTSILVAAGIALGLAAATWGSRLIESRLYGVDPLDPVTHVGGALFFALVALGAAAVPTRGASRIDPMVALRHE